MTSRTVRIRGIRQNIPSGTVIGRSSSGSGPPELISIPGIVNQAINASANAGNVGGNTSITATLPLTASFAAGTWTLAIDKATTLALGVVKPDGSTITITTGGVISAVSSGVTSITATSPLSASASTGAVTLSLGTVPVASGGTGAVTLTSGDLLLGNGTSAVSSLATGTTNQVLQTGGPPTWTSTITSLTLTTCTLSGITTLPNSGSIDANGLYNAIASINGNMLMTVTNNSTGAAAFAGAQWLNADGYYAIFGVVGSGFTPAVGIKAANSAYFVSSNNLAIIASPIQFSVNTSGFTECARFDSSGRLLIGTTSVIDVSGNELQVNTGISLNGTLWFNSSSDFTTGSGTALLGTANCPATTLSAPTKWLKIVVPGVTAGYIPVWE